MNTCQWAYRCVRASYELILVCTCKRLCLSCWYGRHGRRYTHPISTGDEGLDGRIKTLGKTNGAQMSRTQYNYIARLLLQKQRQLAAAVIGNATNLEGDEQQMRMLEGQDGTCFRRAVSAHIHTRTHTQREREGEEGEKESPFSCALARVHVIS